MLRMLKIKTEVWQLSYLVCLKNEKWHFLNKFARRYANLSQYLQWGNTILIIWKTKLNSLCNFIRITDDLVGKTVQNLSAPISNKIVYWAFWSFN